MRQRVRFIAGGLACILVLWLVRPGWAAKTRVAKPPVADTPAADAVVTQPVAVADTVSGRVFLDANGNGRLDPGEQGLAGVAVTDGVSFVTTAADGSYTIKIGDDPVLPHRSTHTVSVCWPSGKWPTGKWWGRLDQIADPKNLNFGLREDPQKRPFSFVQVSDNHGGPYVGFANELKQLGPEVKFLFNTGDLFYANYSGPADANLTYQRYVASTLPGLPLPLFHTPGNHDLCGTNINTDKTHPDYCNGVFTKYLGPIRWSFDYAGAHFVGLDWRYIAPNGVYESGCPQSAIDWLDKDLARVKPGATIIGFIHFPYSPFNFWETLGKYKVTRVLGGHSHRYERLESHGVVATTVLNLRDAACQIGIVGEAGLEIVDRCPGCGKGGAASHSKYCALVSSSLAALQAGRGANYPPGRKSVTNGAAAVQDFAAKGVSISVKLDPGEGKAGLRIGDKQTVEIACTRKGLLVNGVEVPLTVAGPPQLEVFDDGKTLTVYAMPGVRTIQSHPVDQPGKVAIFAEGGTGKFDSFSVWELRGTAMPNTGYK